MLTEQDIQNLLALIANAPIKGGEAVTVALLQQKLTKLLEPEEIKTEPEPTEKEEKKDES